MIRNMWPVGVIRIASPEKLNLNWSERYIMHLWCSIISFGYLFKYLSCSWSRAITMVFFVSVGLLRKHRLILGEKWGWLYYISKKFEKKRLKSKNEELKTVCQDSRSGTTTKLGFRWLSSRSLWTCIQFTKGINIQKEHQQVLKFWWYP